MILDAGALIAVDRSDALVITLLRSTHHRRVELVTASPVVARVWRNGRTQANLARVLQGVKVIAPDEDSARRCGELLAATSTHDVVDGFVVAIARRGDVILISDPHCISALANAAKVAVTVAKI